MSVTIDAIVDWADWPHAGDTVFDVRAKSTQSWVSEEGELVPAGQSRIVGTGTISGVRATLPAISLPSTDVGQDIQTARFTVTLHRTGKLETVLTVLDQFTVPNSFEPAATWAMIRINKNGKIPYRSTSVYTKEESNALAAITAGTLNDASAVIKGRTKLSVAPVSSSNPIAVGDNDPRINTFYNVKGSGAIGDGIADDTVAINAALTLALASRKPLYFPAGDYLVAGSGTQIFLVNKALEIYGDGMSASRIIVKNTTAQTTDIIRVSPPVVNAVGSWLQNAARDNRGYHFHDFSIVPETDQSVLTTPYSTTQPGRHALNFDITTTDQYLHNVTIERCYFGSLHGRGIFFNNSNGAGSWRNQDGVYLFLISNNIIKNGILATFWGDTIKIKNNVFAGENAAIDSSQVTGATTLNIESNNFTSKGGALIARNGYTINFLNNIVEPYTSDAVGSNGAGVDFSGSFDTILMARVEGNQINTALSTDLDGVRGDNVDTLFVRENSFTGAAGFYVVKTTASCINPVIGVNRRSGGIAQTNGDSTTAVYDLFTISADPDFVEAAGFQGYIPGYLGVDRAYTKALRVTSGGTTLLTPSTGPGVELAYESDGRVVAGEYTATGGSGVALLQILNRTTLALRDLYIGSDKLSLSASGGLFVPTTVTAGGTTGAQTINKVSGRVNFAAAASSLVVTNSLVTANSLIIATVQTNDATMKSVLCVPAAGSFTMHANAAATAETKVGFLVLNQ